MSHKATRCILIGAILITQTVWSQTRPAAPERNRALRGRTAPQRDMQADMASQLTDAQSQIQKIQVEQRQFNTCLLYTSPSPRDRS